ncbi:Predicted membrane protein [Candidatus Terasakiella magnetica]|nr:Predicted membrane protein [Candidatus Terasakiella magnetica]
MALTGDIGHLIAAIGCFVGAHSLTNLRPLRHRCIEAVGKAGFYGAYSVLSTVLLVWVVAAAINAPTLVIWQQHGWMRWVPPLVMPVVCLALVAGLTTPNPFSIGPGAKGFDPAHPGILRLTRHPVIWGLGLWTGAHIVPNGHLAGLMLFVPLLVMSLLGKRVLDAKRRQSLGAEEWQRLVDAVEQPLDRAALLHEVGAWRIIGGVALYLALLALHPMVIGLSPLP